MRPRPVVEAEIAADRGSSLEDAGIGSQVNFFTLHCPPETLDADVAAACALLPSMLIAISAAFSTLMKSALVDCEP
jgi:hypothetical protein